MSDSGTTNNCAARLKRWRVDVLGVGADMYAGNYVRGKKKDRAASEALKRRQAARREIERREELKMMGLI